MGGTGVEFLGGELEKTVVGMRMKGRLWKDKRGIVGHLQQSETLIAREQRLEVSKIKYSSSQFQETMS